MTQWGRGLYVFGVHQANKTVICFFIAEVDPIFHNLWKTFSLSWYYLAVQGLCCEGRCIRNVLRGSGKAE